MIYFQNDNIIIRSLKQEDVVPLFCCSIDKETNKFDPKPLPKSSTELLKECEYYCSIFHNEMLNESIADRKYLYFIITDNKDNFIGFVNFFSMDKLKKQGEMGVIIGDKRCLKKGIASLAVNAATHYIFDTLKFNRIYVETGEMNLPALGLFSKLGFNKCGEDIDEDFKFIVMEKINSK